MSSLFTRLRRSYRKPVGRAGVHDRKHVSPGSWQGTERVLVKEVNWLGDLVISLPALRLIRRAFPDAKLSVLVRENLAAFFDGMDWVDEVIPYRTATGLHGWAGQRNVVAAIRSRHFDVAMIFPNSFRAALWMTLAGIRRRAGYATDGRRLLLTDFIVPKASETLGHQRFYWLEMVRNTLGISPEIADGAPEPLEVSQQSVVRMREFLVGHRRTSDAPTIALSSLAAFGPAKEWPPQYYAKLIDLVDELAGGECVLLGAASDRPKCERIAAMSRKGAIIAAGATDVSELKALLSLCDGFAGNDSGAMHLAAALGIPTVGIFGSTNPMRTGPVGPKTMVVYHPLECSPCLQRTCRFGHYRCLQEIAPEEVARALVQLGAFANFPSAASHVSS